MMRRLFCYFTILALLFFPTVLQAVTESLRFERFQHNERLPSNSVNRLYHDKEGFMWFGTRDGLCRFDGYDIKLFRSSVMTPGKLANNEIQYIAEDNRNRIWVGTIEGINIIDKRNFSIKTLDNPFINKERINAILQDRKGNMWIATTNFGVICMNPETEEFIRYSTENDSPLRLNSNAPTYIYEDSEGKIWLTFWNSGLAVIDTEKNTVIHAPPMGGKNNPFRFFQDHEGLYWACSWGDGIFRVKTNGNSIHFENIPISPKSEKTVNEIVYSITQDNQGRIWLVTFTGLDILTKDVDGSYIVTDAKPLFNSDDSQLFHSIIKDRRDNLWLGSVGEGVFQMDFNKLPIRNYPLKEIQRYNAQSYVTRFAETNNGELFVVINRVGLFHFDIKTETVTRPSDPVLRNIRTISTIMNHKHSAEIWLANEGDKVLHIFRHAGRENLVFKESLYLPEVSISTENSITAMYEDNAGNVWIGANNGLFVKSPGQNIRTITEELRFINDIKVDIQGRVWVGTDKSGLFYLTSDSRQNSGYSINRVELIVKNHESLSVQSILCRNNGDVYIATKEGGLYHFDRYRNTAEELSSVYGISEEGFLEIIEDNFGNIWLTTLKRIIRYNPETHASIYYSTSDGILVSAFFKNAIIKLKSGDILFGGNNGICGFSPEIQRVSEGSSTTNVRITDIFVQNRSLFDLAGYNYFNPDRRTLKLQHNQSNISIEFSALDYSSASKIQYAYRLSGIDKDWNYVGNTRRFVNYTSLAPGSYTFQIKASDENGVWSDRIKSLRITVQPPLYLSWWAYLIYMAVIVIVLYFISNTVANRIRLRNELKISHIEKEKTEELTQIKLRYFTNISHELLTPLTIIMLQIESLQKKITDQSVQFDVIRENVLRLKRLIKQILVFRKTETGNMKLRVINSDIVAFIKNICQSSFNPQVEEKGINFSVDIQYESYMAYFDPDKLDKIIYNILSNAFKFTPKGGSIALKMSFVPRGNDIVLRLSVSDTGIGIPEQDIPHIFKRFYISSSADQSQSHGIGLSLTNDLLEIHHGKIEVVSQVGEGSVFTIEIPVSESAYTEDEKHASEDNDFEIADSITLKANIDEEDNEIQELDNEIQFSILVVEDNKGLNKLISENFSEKYQVYNAENGLQALQIIKDHDIDLIISDVMMPEMDGLTFCKIIKNDLSTSHIAVLMLTAKNSAEDRIECYNAGADAFIAKPFELGVLNARVKNLISKIKQKAEKFQHGHDINISSMEYNSIDEVFLKSAVTKVEEKLADEGFDFDQFAIDMSTSKSTLHRKLKSLTGLSPGEFIRNIRMKHAVQMLSNNIGNISEIAYAVGFNDPKYFSRCFKSEFGMTPKDWVEKNKKKK